MRRRGDRDTGMPARLLAHIEKDRPARTPGRLRPASGRLPPAGSKRDGVVQGGGGDDDGGGGGSNRSKVAAPSRVNRGPEAEGGRSSWALSAVRLDGVMASVEQ